MKNRLARIGAGVDNSSESRAGDSHFLRHSRRYRQQSAQNGFIPGLHVVHRFNVPPGDYQHVNRRLGIDILKRYAVIVLVQDSRRSLMRGDPAENTSHHNPLQQPVVEGSTDAFDIRTQGRQFLLETEVSPVQMVDPVHNRLALGDQRGQYE